MHCCLMPDVEGYMVLDADALGSAQRLLCPEIEFLIS